MGYHTITVEIDDYVALIRLNRPDALNALNSELLGELSSALTDADYMVGVILRTGAPGVGPNVVATAYLEAAMQDQGLEGGIRTRAFRPLLSKAGYTPAHRTSSYTWQGKRLRIWVRSGLPTKPTQEWVREELDKTLEGAFDD